MAKFARAIGNYYQHMMDILTSDRSYEDISDLYNLYYEEEEKISPESLRKSHKGKNRGNLPSGIKPGDFYTRIVEEVYQDEKQLGDFARRLYKSLEKDDLLPDDWKEQMDRVSGFSQSFDKEIFYTYILCLLEKDIENKKTAEVLKESPKDPTQKTVFSSENSDEEGVNASLKSASSPLALSEGFFNAGAREIMGLEDEAFYKEIQRLSDIFKNISRVELKGSADTFCCEENLIVSLKEWIASHLKLSKNRAVLKVKGPLGSYKNRLMQYLYLTIERELDFVAPIYIDLAFYEKAAEGNEGVDEKAFFKAFEKDLKAAEKILSKMPDKKPLFMLDGIRDFNCRNESLYYAIHEKLQRKNWYLIVCMDTDFTVNNQNRYDVHPLVSNNYECYLRLRSMNLNRKKESIEFIQNCIDVFRVPLSFDVSAEQIYDNLVRLNILNLDAYWLTYILRSYLNDILNHKSNISGLYNAICLGFLGSHNLVESASEFAFEFEFGKRDFNNTNPYFDLRWRLIRKHRSVLDFLIAKFYIKKVSELNLERGTKEQNIEKLGFFNMVLQKNITRFVVTMLKGIDDYERQIMIIATRYYDQLDLFGKSELTFWMARLQNPMRKNECVKLLRQYNQKELERYEKDEFNSIEEKRKAAFLLRGINVSLIYENDKQALKYYLESLLEDKIANSVNRGFHLEYYGDKPYIPNKSLLDFEDNVSCGEGTITVLCLSLDRRSRNSPVALLEIMTLCNLIQARIQCGNKGRVLDVEPYIDRCIEYLDWVIPQRVLRGMDKVKDYFCWMQKELQEYKALGQSGSEKTYRRARIFNKFVKTADVKRSGWVHAKVSRPENVVEHMYQCWLLGMLHLPNTYDEPDYSKDRILQMLLIHDLGEAVTGDIDRSEKLQDPEYYDKQENEVMQGLFLSGTYPGATDLRQYQKLWNQWYAKEGINYLIAKDIDNIQTIYQFCKYYLEEPKIFSEEDVFYWLSGIDRIETEIGKEITDVLIVDNPLFEEILNIYEVE